LRLRATHDPLVYTLKARQAFMAGFERAVDPNGTLPAPEREARAMAARKAHFGRLAMKSAEARRGRPPPEPGK